MLIPVLHSSISLPIANELCTVVTTLQAILGALTHHQKYMTNVVYLHHDTTKVPIEMKMGSLFPKVDNQRNASRVPGAYLYNLWQSGTA